jgi:hypothetical protein
MTWFLQTVIGSHYTSRIWSTIANQTESQIFYLSHAIFLKLVNRTKQDLVQHYICFDDFLLALHLIIVDFCFVKYSQCIYWLVCYIYSRYIYLYKILCFFTFLPKCTSVLNTTLCDKVCQWLATGWWFSPGTPVSSTNKTECHDITEILLKVGLNTITLPIVPQYHSFIVCLHIHTGDRSHGSTLKTVQHFHSWWIVDGLSMEGVGLSGYNTESY